MQDILRAAAELVLHTIILSEKDDFTPTRSISLRLESLRHHSLALEKFDAGHFTLYLPRSKNGIACSLVKYVNTDDNICVSSVEGILYKINIKDYVNATKYFVIDLSNNIEWSYTEKIFSLYDIIYISNNPETDQAHIDQPHGVITHYKSPSYFTKPKIFENHQRRSGGRTFIT